MYVHFSMHTFKAIAGPLIHIRVVHLYCQFHVFIPPFALPLCPVEVITCVKCQVFVWILSSFHLLHECLPLDLVLFHR